LAHNGMPKIHTQRRMKNPSLSQPCHIYTQTSIRSAQARMIHKMTGDDHPRISGQTAMRLAKFFAVIGPKMAFSHEPANQRNSCRTGLFGIPVWPEAPSRLTKPSSAICTTTIDASYPRYRPASSSQRIPGPYMTNNAVDPPGFCHLQLLEHLLSPL